ncbi:MAG: hypothetical protein ACJ731_10760 [Vicinamibacterales bacterium]
MSLDLLVLLALAVVIIVAATLRREFLGDGVRHLPAILSSRIQPGEPRWLLFPALANLWVRLMSAIGLVAGVESALRALVVLSVVSGIVFLVSIRAWLRAECNDDARRAAALLLAGSCAPFLLLFSDVAEPQVAAGIAAAGLACARVWRDDVRRAPAAALVAVATIAIASLMYQGIMLAFGMLPLVVSAKTTSVRRVAVASGVAVLLVMTTMVAAQVATGTPAAAAATTVVRGERNPLTRSLMADRSPWKYLAATLAGPPQGIVTLRNYSGLRTMVSSLRSSDAGVAATGIGNVARLFLGCAIAAVLLRGGVRDRQWRVLAAAAVLLALPVIRNQQYAYVKFHILWPIPVALLAMRCRARTIWIAAAIALAVNGYLLSEEVRRGRDHASFARAAYATATPATCWVTSGWAPPFTYLWPGTTATMLGTLATGIHPADQGATLTTALQRCFCDSTSVWTDGTARDAEIVRSLATHFEYTSIDLASLLIDPNEANSTPMPGVLVYSDAARQRACRATAQ